jgi:hypothetical protein
MTVLDNHLYYLDREQSALRLAEAANEAAIRKLHLAMAKEYRARATLAAAPANAAQLA